MHRLLLIYASQEGQTEKIAAQVAAEAARVDIDAQVFAIEQCPADLDPGAFDAVIIGGSIHRGNFPRVLRDLLIRHHERLNLIPSAFFSVSLGAASEHPEERAEIRRLTEDFVSGTGWRPVEIRTFAGALRYSKYNWLIRWIMRRIAKKEGGGTDTRRDYEYTDWGAVRSFASRFLASATAPAADAAEDN